MLSSEEHAFTEALFRAVPGLVSAAEAVRAFAQLLLGNDPAGRMPRLEAAAATGLGGLVTGLRQDEAAVRTAIAEPWSDDPVDEQVNRLELVKRSMYGRAGLDFLRQRVQHAT